MSLERAFRVLKYLIASHRQNKNGGEPLHKHPVNLSAIVDFERKNKRSHYFLGGFQQSLLLLTSIPARYLRSLHSPDFKLHTYLAIAKVLTQPLCSLSPHVLLLGRRDYPSNLIPRPIFRM